MSEFLIHYRDLDLVGIQKDLAGTREHDNAVFTKSRYVSVIKTGIWLSIGYDFKTRFG